MVAAAYALTGGSLADPIANLVLWGSAAAAVVAALIVLSNGPAVIGWAAIGYVVFAALFAAARPVPLLLLLGAAYVPVLQRPRGSLVAGMAALALTVLALVLVMELRPALR